MVPLELCDGEKRQGDLYTGSMFVLSTIRLFMPVQEMISTIASRG